MSPVVDVVRTYLELRSPEQLRATYTDDPRVQFRRCDNIAADHYRRLYRSVGERWYWRDRNGWSDQRLIEHLSRASVSVWECLVGDETAGYFELERRDDDSVEIAYFGLLEEFVGRGLGKAMLTRAAEEAWAFGAARVWLHTCTLDSPYALSNYKARGFDEVRRETFVFQTS